jgi:hypothetical protein
VSTPNHAPAATSSHMLVSLSLGAEQSVPIRTVSGAKSDRSTVVDGSVGGSMSLPEATPDIDAASTALVSAPPVANRLHTRLQDNIVRPKIFIDGTMRYDHHGLSITCVNHKSYIKALTNAHWKRAMDSMMSLQHLRGIRPNI